VKAKVRRMYPVESKVIHKFGFDWQTPGVDRGYLVIQFTNMSVYGYADVLWSDFLAFVNAESPGTAFHGVIKKYKSVQLTDGDGHIVEQSSVTAPQKPITPKEEMPLLGVLEESVANGKRRLRK
jgi:hypothetical protein